jgi:predicted Zn-dependent protease
MKKCVLLVMVLFCLGCAIVPITGRRQISFIPAAELTALSAVQFKEMKTHAAIVTDGIQVQMVSSVGEKIAGAAEEFMRMNDMKDVLATFNWEFLLVKDDAQANAFCMPGGKVVVYSGILPFTQDEEGLAVVIGHEIAHAIANHGGERLSQTLLVELGQKSLTAAMESKPTKTKELIMTAYGAGAEFGLLLPYSRMHEYEADHIGLVVMALAGYDPNAALKFWERMAASGSDAPFEFLSTHPVPENRIEQIKQLIPAALNYRKK